ncbi:hypothetical protein Hanom_Chr02g00136531 [Helianthus anomalus]
MITSKCANYNPLKEKATQKVRPRLLKPPYCIRTRTDCTYLLPVRLLKKINK